MGRRVRAFIPDSELVRREEQDPWEGTIIKYELPGHGLHRDEGPAYQSDHTQVWYCYGKKHREGAPASISSRYRRNMRYYEWWHWGKQHRIDGPAGYLLSDDDGKMLRTWSSPAWIWKDNWCKNLTHFLKVATISDEEKLLLKLKWG